MTGLQQRFVETKKDDRLVSYRMATQADNSQLIELTAASGMTGETSLRIDRQPDFFRLLDMRGESKVFVAFQGDRIVGSLCVSRQQVYVGGTVCSLQYIGDFKVAATHRNKGIGLQLCNKMADYLIELGADLVFLNVSKGNQKPLSFFKNRPQVPDFDNIGGFNIHQFTGKKKKAFHQRYKIDADLPDGAMIEFLNNRYSKYELGPVIIKQHLADTNIFSVRQDGQIIAAMCIADTMPVKQNVVTRVSRKMKWMLRLINAGSCLLGISKMPVLHQPVKMLYIKYLAVTQQEDELVKLLVAHARNLAYTKSYSFVSIGVHEKDPLNKYFSGLFKFTFNSVGMLLSIRNNRALIEKVREGIPFEDYSLV